MPGIANTPNPPDAEPSHPEPSVPLRVLPGSDRGPAPRLLGAAATLSGEESIAATLVLRRRADVPSSAFDAHLNSTELSALYGASDDDVALVTETLHVLGVQITATDPASRRIQISGTAELLSTLFGTRLEQVTSMGPHNHPFTHRHRTGSLSVPATLDGVVTAVLGLDDRPQSHPQYVVAPNAATTTGYTPPQLGMIYDFPAGTDGSGQTIAIIELGGGFGHADLDAYFNGLGITGPLVKAIGVDGASNVPGQDPQGADGEVLLDIEVAGALAPKAVLAVYFAPNTDAGFLDAISQAAHASPAPAAMSISWGQSEDDWTAQARTALDQALMDAALLGVSVTVAAGDNGSTDRGTDSRDHADFPASSPHALACGGTRLTANTSTGAVASETVWNDSPTSSATGGGVSDAFPLPAWQRHITVNAGVQPRPYRTAAASPTLLPWQTRKPATKSGSTAPTWCTEARAPWHPCGRRSWHDAPRLPGTAWGWCSHSSTATQARAGCRPDSATSPRATTAATTPPPAGMPAPASASPRERHCLAYSPLPQAAGHTDRCRAGRTIPAARPGPRPYVPQRHRRWHCRPARWRARLRRDRERSAANWQNPG